MILPQFPLGLVLFPTMAVPLQIFEDRYRRLLNDIVDDERRFGVVLIERGTDTGGEDQRFAIGTVAELIEVGELPGDRLGVLAVGTDRYRIENWLPDDPYPRAEIELWPDQPDPSGDHGGEDADERRDDILERLESCLSRMAARNGDQIEMPPIAEDPRVASFQLSALMPVGPLDKQRLLAVPSTLDRLNLLDELLTDTTELIDFLDRE